MLTCNTQKIMFKRDTYIQQNEAITKIRYTWLHNKVEKLNECNVFILNKGENT